MGSKHKPKMKAAKKHVKHHELDTMRDTVRQAELAGRRDEPQIVRLREILTEADAR